MTKRRLGDEMFVVRQDSTIGRAVVNRVAADGSSCVAGPTIFAEYYASYEEAVAAAKRKLTVRELELEQKLRDVRSQIAALASPEHRQKVAEMPISGTDGRRSIPVPESYFKPGWKVYAVITPQTFHSFTQQYRPAPYFVLITTVNAAYLAPTGEVLYYLGTAFRTEEVYASLAEARERAAAIIAEEVGATVLPEKIRLVSEAEEKAADQGRLKQYEDMVKGGPYLSEELDSSAYTD